MTDSVERLYKAVVAARDLDPVTSRTAKLLRGGQAKMAKKLAEEAIEVVIDAMKGDSAAVIRESADLIYNLAVVWAASGVKPGDIWAEMDRRERLLGIAEKLPKPPKGKKRREAAPSTAPAPPATAAAIPTRRPLAISEVRHAPKRR
ncbi:MAG: phosphoribosyl-ATP diphosphatase [Xanthobacteraceae bacterium]